MQFRSIQAVTDDRVYSINLPDKGVISLDGNSASKSYILTMICTVLGLDYSSTINKEAKGVLRTKASLGFLNGNLTLSDGSVTMRGKVPYIHCVYLNAESVGVSSFFISDIVKRNSIDIDMTRYTSDIEEKDWVRLLSLYNKYAGFESARIVTYPDGSKKLEFNGMTRELETAYLLLSESFLTPSDYIRIVLIPELSYIDNNRLVELVRLMSHIRQLEMIIIANDVDLSKNTFISSVSC